MNNDMSMFTKEKRERFISILSDGKFHETVAPGTEDAVLREYETSDGKKGSKWEMVYSKIAATITNVTFQDGDFGENIQLHLSGEEGDVVVSVSTESNFGEDIMKKLPKVDLSKPVELSPYAFTDDKGKNVRGVSIFQNGEKLTNFFYDGEKNINGYPSVENRDEMTKPKWKIYFLQAREFLIEYTKKNIVLKLSQQSISTEAKPEPHNSDPDAIDEAFAAAIAPEDVPF